MINWAGYHCTLNISIPLSVGTQSWTGDLLICSQMLYHWAIPYTLIYTLFWVGETQTKLWCFPDFQVRYINQWSTELDVLKSDHCTLNLSIPLSGGTQSWTGDLLICSQMLCHWAIPPVRNIDFTLTINWWFSVKPAWSGWNTNKIAVFPWVSS